MPFEFVDNNVAIDRTARRRIRSHVAMGRNAGRTLVRPSRRKAAGRGGAVVATFCIPRIVEDDSCSLGSKDEGVYAIERLVGNGLSVVSFPDQVDVKSRGLVQRGVYSSFQADIRALSPAAVVVANLGLSSFLLHKRATPRPRATQFSRLFWNSHLDVGPIHVPG
jgi:hypothetical protein